MVVIEINASGQQRFSFPVEDVAAFKQAIIDSYKAFIHFSATDYSGFPHLCKTTSFEYVFNELSEPFEHYKEWYFFEIENVDYNSEIARTEYEELLERVLENFWDQDDYEFVNDVINVWNEMNLVFSISYDLNNFDQEIIDEVRNSPLQEIW